MSIYYRNYLPNTILATEELKGKGRRSKRDEKFQETNKPILKTI